MATTAKLTLDEYLALPETKPYSEYVDGEVVQKTMPSFAHSVVQSLLSLVFGLYLRANPIGICGSEMRCIIGPPGEELARLPDFLFIRMERLIGVRGNRPFTGAPDFAVEILSPDDRMSEVMTKVAFYLTHGVRLVWIIDPEARTVMVMTTPAEMRVFTDNDTLDGGDVLPGFSTPVRDILPPSGLLSG